MHIARMGLHFGLLGIAAVTARSSIVEGPPAPYYVIKKNIIAFISAGSAAGSAGEQSPPCTNFLRLLHLGAWPISCFSDHRRPTGTYHLIALPSQTTTAAGPSCRPLLSSSKLVPEARKSPLPKTPATAIRGRRTETQTSVFYVPFATRLN